jgi:hypothetical protein
MTITNDLAVLAGGAGGGMSFRNRIINGDMRIDQRNNGASVTASTTGAGVYTVDRWEYYTTQTSKFTIQQNAGSVTPPAGFTNYLGFTSSSSYTVTSTDLIVGYQWIEGYNVADLNFGTANAKTITVSFWAYSSLTGTFAGSLVGTNGSTSRSYVFTFSISSANTWTYITVTIPGDTTTFSYNTTNGQGLALCFNLGCGSNYQTTAGSWTSSNYYSVSGAQNIVSTNGAKFYVTGVQLEVGSAATPFEHRYYGLELSLCQRYYQISQNLIGIWGGTAIQGYLSVPVVMRATPSMVVLGGSTSLSVTDTVNAAVTQSSASYGLQVGNNVSGNNSTWWFAAGNFSGLTNYRAYYIASGYNGSTYYPLGLSAEL